LLHRWVVELAVVVAADLVLVPQLLVEAAWACQSVAWARKVLQVVMPMLLRQQLQQAVAGLPFAAEPHIPLAA